MTRAAKNMDERVTLQSRVAVTDAMGQAVITWTTQGLVWASVQALGAREFFAAAQTQQDDSIRVRIRHRADVDQTWRLLWRGLAYDITGIRFLGRREYLDLMCLQGVKDGR